MTIQSGYFKNPIIPGFYSDPSLCRDGEDYYVVCSSFEFFPGIPVFHSRDLINWKQISYCLTTEEMLPLGNAGTSDGIYAPTLRKHKNLFYMITSNRCAKDGNHFFVTAENPVGPYCNPVWIRDINKHSIDGVDPSLFFDDDGTAYFSCVAWDEKGQGIGQAKIDLSSGCLLEPLCIIWHGTGATFPEGPHTYKIHDWYYLIIAEGGTEYGHKVSIARARNIQGPYEACPHNPVLTQNYQYVQSGSIQGVGHGDLFEAHDGTWWLIVHGFRTSLGKLHHLGRETMLVPVSWDKNQWPVANETGWLEELVPLPDIFSDRIQQPIPDFTDDFSSEYLDLRWNFLRNPLPHNYHFGDNENPGLTLTCSSSTLNQEGRATWLGIRQRHFDCHVKVAISCRLLSAEEAGLTVFQTPEHHYDVVITCSDGHVSTFLRKIVGDICWIGPAVPLTSSDFLIAVDATRTEYHFSVTCAGQTYNLGSGRTQLLSTESMLYQNFTGTFFALFACSEQAMPGTANITSFQYYV